MYTKKQKSLLELKFIHLDKILSIDCVLISIMVKARL